jgi:hypothetical protein
MNNKPKFTTRANTPTKYLEFLQHISKMNAFLEDRQTKTWKVNRYMATWLISKGHLTRVGQRVKWTGPEPSHEMVMSFISDVHDYTTKRKALKKGIKPTPPPAPTPGTQLTIHDQFGLTLDGVTTWISHQKDPKIIQALESFCVQFLKKSTINNYQILKTL